MPVGRVGFKGPTDPRVMGGNINPKLALGLGMRAAAKAGVGGDAAAKPDYKARKAQQDFDRAAAEAFGIKRTKPTNKGRQNVAVVKQAPVKQAKTAATFTRTPKRKPA